MSVQPLIGIDFDNTIVCYDSVFQQLAIERKIIAPADQISKRALHDMLHAAGKADLWTELQGEAYGPAMRLATPFAGVLEFFDHCRASGLSFRVISHRTRYPYLGPRYDLHRAAREWLASYEVSVANTGSQTGGIYFEFSRDEKIQRIVNERCTHFIDDLIEVFEEPAFPAGVRKILFDPLNAHSDFRLATRAASWAQVEEILASDGILPRGGGSRCGFA